jgi:predicted dithiol-disulfide oxidoreductase (DUF899 family)
MAAILIFNQSDITEDFLTLNPYLRRVKRESKIHLDFVIDKLTNCIQNTISGDSFSTDVSCFTKADLKQVSKKNGWNFNWASELRDNTKEVYKLTITNNPNIIQGLISFTIKEDHIYMDLLESAPFNLGRNKLYEGVPGNLVAYACKVAFQRGFDGFLSFTAKTKLIEHYEKSLGAYHFENHLMIIQTSAAQKLIDKYFKS